MSLFPKSQAILPVTWRQDRPLFLVLAILTFLACLSALTVRTTHRAAGTWGDDLKNAATLQIKLEPGQSVQDISDQTVEYLIRREEVRLARSLSEGRARDLLRPWLGDVELPENLPVPILVEVVLEDGQRLNKDAVSTELRAMGINVEIDDHSRWNADIARTAAATQTIGIGALALLLLAMIAAAGFATEAGLAARRTIVRVLTQVGATPAYIARLFTGRFLMLGIKAGTLGGLLAALAASLLWAASGRGASAFLPSLRLETADILILVASPFITGLVCAIAARFTVMRSLNDRTLI